MLHDRYMLACGVCLASFVKAPIGNISMQKEEVTKEKQCEVLKKMNFHLLRTLKSLATVKIADYFLFNSISMVSWLIDWFYAFKKNGLVVFFACRDKFNELVIEIVSKLFADRFNFFVLSIVTLSRSFTFYLACGWIFFGASSMKKYFRWKIGQ